MPTPPFRADHVGSLLRPKRVAERAAPRTSPPPSCTPSRTPRSRRCIRMQEDVGLKAVTDGEFRRACWHFDFMGMLDGLDIETREGGGVQFHGMQTTSPTCR